MINYNVGKEHWTAKHSELNDCDNDTGNQEGAALCGKHVERGGGAEGDPSFHLSGTTKPLPGSGPITSSACSPVKQV